MIKKADIILAAVLVVLSVVFIFVFAASTPVGNKVVITLNNEVYGEYPLLTDNEIEVKTESGFNTVVIKEGSVFVLSADCPDKYCVKHKKISNVGETVVCLPHKLVVEVRGGKNG